MKTFQNHFSFLKDLTEQKRKKVPADAGDSRTWSEYIFYWMGKIFGYYTITGFSGEVQLF